MTDERTLSAFERVVRAIGAKLTDREIEVAVGTAAASEMSQPKRVVFVPTGGRLTPPERQAYTHPAAARLRIRPLYTNQLVVAARISGESMAELETTWLDVLSATRLVLGTASQPTVYRILSEADALGVSARSHYAELVQSFEWSLSLSTVTDTKTDSTIFGERTAIVLSFELDALIGANA